MTAARPAPLARPGRLAATLARDAWMAVATATIACVLGSCAGQAGRGHAAVSPSASPPAGASVPPPPGAAGASSPPDGALATSSSPPQWLLTRAALSQLVTDPGVRAGLRRCRVYQLLQPGQRPLGGLVTVPVVVFPSAADLVKAVTGRHLPAGTGAVLYDPEAWSFTPASEQRNPGQAAQRAAAAAHAHGLKLIVTPALNLVTVRGHSSAPRWQQFLSQRIAAAVAVHADFVELQAQSLERSAATYSSFVRQGAAQVRTANPQAAVLAGLSTNPPGAAVSPQHLTAAIAATRGIAAGYWLNIPGRGPKCPACNSMQPRVGIQALREVLPGT
jgi:hypothetical protein